MNVTFCDFYTTTEISKKNDEQFVFTGNFGSTQKIRSLRDVACYVSSVQLPQNKQYQ
jgi:hypothetical protein